VALADSLGLVGWLAGPGPWIYPATAVIDRDMAADVCEQCMADATLAVPVHNPVTPRYRVFSVCPNCKRIGEI
jgi:hypothetical protein